MPPTPVEELWKAATSVSVLSASVVHPNALLSAAEACVPLVELGTRKSFDPPLKESAFAPRMGARGKSATVVVAGVVP